MRANTEDVFKRPLTAQEAVTRELRRAITAGELEPGQRIHQEELSKRLGVSRVPIREALRGLESEGLTVSRPNRGYYVTRLTVSELEEIYRLRSLLEDEMNCEAATNMNEQTIAHLEELLGKMDEAAQALNVRDFVTFNKRFHFMIFKQAGLLHFLQMTDMLWQKSGAYRSLYLSDSMIVWSIREEHSLILQACKNRDSEELTLRSKYHREQAVARLSRLLHESG